MCFRIFSIIFSMKNTLNEKKKGQGLSEATIINPFRTFNKLLWVSFYFGSVYLQFAVCVSAGLWAPKPRQRSEHISGCKCHVAAEWWMSRAFDVWERSEHNSQFAVTPYHTLMIQSMLNPWMLCSHLPRGGGVVWKLYLCSAWTREGHIVIWVKDSFLPDVCSKLRKLHGDDCELCGSIETLKPSLHMNTASSTLFLLL